MTTGLGYGQAGSEDFVSQFAQTKFVAKRLMAQMRTCVPVKVNAVRGGGVAAPCIVDVLPLISELDGNGNAVVHGVVNNIPCFRLQGGNAAIIIDPVVGDIGYIQIADRDISAAKSTPGKQVNPASYRTYDFADGIYMGGFLNAAPTCYIMLGADGTITIVSSDNMLTFNANITVNGFIHATGAVIAGSGTGDQVGVQTHTHPANGSPPNPGT